MKKEIMKEVHFCDACEKESHVYTCLGCGVEHCYGCSKTLGIEYSRSVYSGGSGDGYFCLTCDAEPPAKVIGLHEAYKNIKMLSAYQDASYKTFEKRGKEAEELLKQERTKLGLN